MFFAFPKLFFRSKSNNEKGGKKSEVYQAKVSQVIYRFKRASVAAIALATVKVTKEEPLLIYESSVNVTKHQQTFHSIQVDVSQTPYLCCFLFVKKTHYFIYIYTVHLCFSALMISYVVSFTGENSKGNERATKGTGGETCTGFCVNHFY